MLDLQVDAGLSHAVVLTLETTDVKHKLRGSRQPFERQTHGVTHSGTLHSSTELFEHGARWLYCTIGYVAHGQVASWTGGESATDMDHML